MMAIGRYAGTAVLTKFKRTFKVSLPKAKVEFANPENVTDRILKRTSVFEAKTQHHINQPVAHKLHRNLATEIQQTCDFLLIQLQQNAKIMNGSTTGALMHILSVMQDTLWESELLIGHYSELIDHAWHEAHRFAPDMSISDACCVLYAFYSFRDFLHRIKPRSGISGEDCPSNYDHRRLMELTLDKCRSRIELATSGDALGALLGMAVMNRKDDELIDRLVEVHVLPQIPFADYEVLGYVSYAAGLLQPSQKIEVMDLLAARFKDLRDEEYRDLSIESMANALFGLSCVDHKDGRSLASNMIQFIDRASRHTWRPRAICRLAWAVGRFDAYTPSFVGTILKETIKSSKFFNLSEVRLFKEAIDLMNIEPSDEVWKRLSRSISQ